MSTAIQVFLPDTRLPTVEEWNAAIKAEGFDLALNPFNPRKDNGYRPALIHGEDSGFEWYLSTVMELKRSPDFPFAAEIGNCDVQASLVFGSRADEAAAASVAGAVLAKLAGGCYHDAEGSGGLLRGDEAIA